MSHTTHTTNNDDEYNPLGDHAAMFWACPLLVPTTTVTASLTRTGLGWTISMPLHHLFSTLLESPEGRQWRRWSHDGSLDVFCVMFPVIASVQAFKVVVCVVAPRGIGT